MMFRLLMFLLILFSPLWSDVTMKHKKRETAILPVHPIHRPSPKLPYYIPSINNGIIVENHTDCSQYIKLLKEKDAYIKSLLHELTLLRQEHQDRLSEQLRKKHEVELKAFEEKKRSVNTQNTIIISDKPKKRSSQ